MKEKNQESRRKSTADRANRQPDAGAAQEHNGELTLETPSFLAKLDSDSSAAFEEFYSFSKQLIRVAAPPAFRRLPRDAQEDALHSMVYHCCRDDFRVLRKYRPMGRTFAAWLARVIHNFVIEESMRDKSLSTAAETGVDSEDLAPSAERIVEAKRAVAVAANCLADMPLDCRILLLARANGLKPREMTRLLGLPDSANRQVSDRCRYCRAQLLEMLRQRAVNIDELLG